MNSQKWIVWKSGPCPALNGFYESRDEIGKRVLSLLEASALKEIEKMEESSSNAW